MRTHARLIAVILALAVVLMACGGGGGGTTVLAPTATPTAVPFTLVVNSSPQGAHIELNPRSDGHGGYIAASGRDLGLSPLNTILQPGDIQMDLDGVCGTIVLLAWGIPGYTAISGSAQGCLSGVPSPHLFEWDAELQACPVDDGPDCGMLSQ